MPFSMRTLSAFEMTCRAAACEIPPNVLGTARLLPSMHQMPRGTWSNGEYAGLKFRLILSLNILLKKILWTLTSFDWRI